MAEIRKDVFYSFFSLNSSADGARMLREARATRLRGGECQDLNDNGGEVVQEEEAAAVVGMIMV